MRPGLLIAVLVSALAALSACTGGSDGEEKSDGNKEAGVTFMAAVNQETRTWAKDAAARFFDEAVKDFARTSEIEAFNTNGISKRLCEQVKSFKKETGKGTENGSIKTAGEAIEFSKTSAFDSAVAGLLEHALAAPEAERETLLKALKVEAFPADGGTNKLSGTAALTQAGLLNANGQLVFPQTEHLSSGPDDAYAKYRSWLVKESPGLLKPANNLVSGIDDDLDKCTSQA